MDSIVEYWVIALGLGFLSSRLAKMIEFSMNPYHFLWPVKKWLIGLDTSGIDKGYGTHEELINSIEELLDAHLRYSFLARLLDCVFCITIWVSIIVTAIYLLLVPHTYNTYELWYFLFVPVSGFLITEKI